MMGCAVAQNRERRAAENRGERSQTRQRSGADRIRLVQRRGKRVDGGGRWASQPVDGERCLCSVREGGEGGGMTGGER